MSDAIFWNRVEVTDPTYMGKFWQISQASGGLAYIITGRSPGSIDEFCDRWAAYVEGHTRARVGSFLAHQMSRAEVEAMRDRAKALAMGSWGPGDLTQIATELKEAATERAAR